MSKPATESVPASAKAKVLSGASGLPQLFREVVNAPWYPRQYPVGFTSLNLEDDRNIRIKGFIESESDTKVCVCNDTWGTTRLVSSLSSWLEVAADDRDLQTGTAKYPGVLTLGQNATITFPKAFSETPTVIVWLTSFDVGTSASGKGVWRINASASTVTTTTFSLKLDNVKSDSTIVNAEVCWLAIPSDRSNLASGSFTTKEGTETKPGYFVGTVKFATPLPSTPRVLCALNSFEVRNAEGKFVMNLAIPEFAISKEKLTWTVEGAGDESPLISAGGSFVAFASY
ncbi:hypothetical protein B0H21DRAFT_748381 [Amylocystis lapponica]|nr:hypothetical protein B0H21DRAFT_748381 [Amylocystis lapponica]